MKNKRVIVDRRIDKPALELLNELGFQTIFSTVLPNISDCTATHPDMQICICGRKKAYVCSSALEYYNAALPDYELIPAGEPTPPYPNDCILNLTFIGRFCFVPPKTNVTLPENIVAVPVKQGYTKCNICVLNDLALISSDSSILTAARKNGLRAYYMPADEIALPGYKNGFWGGCTGLIDNNLLFFNGNIEKLACIDELLKILECEKIEPVYYTDRALCDNGSILPA